jgi:hypothetical protein
MGVEYKHYLIPEDNTYKPRPEDLSRLVNALLEDGFVAETGTDAFKKMTFSIYGYYEYADSTGCFAHVGDRTYRSFPCPCFEQEIAALGERDFRLVWPVQSSNDSGLMYPLTPFPEWGDAYYELELHMAKDFVYHMSELVDPFKKVVCGCGRSLDYDPETNWGAGHPVYYDCRIYRRCPSCGRLFRPQELVARLRDGHTGEKHQRAGGATYLFAVVIDCGKGWPRQAWPIRATSESLGLVTRTLGQRFYEIGDIY